MQACVLGVWGAAASSCSIQAVPRGHLSYKDAWSGTVVRDARTYEVFTEFHGAPIPNARTFAPLIKDHGAHFKGTGTLSKKINIYGALIVWSRHNIY